MNQNLKKMEDEELITRRTGPVDENNGILNKVSNLVSDNSTNERLAEIELTRNRMNGVNPSSEQEEQHEKDLLKDIPEEMMQQRLGVPYLKFLKKKGPHYESPFFIIITNSYNFLTITSYTILIHCLLCNITS